MLIDTTFDFRTDARGKDPDTWSPTLCRYHEHLWSKPLPSGQVFDLVPPARPPYYFDHASMVGKFVLSSDAFIPTYTRYGVPRSVLDQLPAGDQDHFNAISYTIGGLILWPANRVEGKWTINQARGCLGRAIGDRMDLTLECIRRHYDGEPSPLRDVLARYAEFFAAFNDFHGYVNFWLLPDMLVRDNGGIRFFMPFDHFRTPAIPQDLESYVAYRRHSIEFVEARNERIASSV